MYKCIFRDLDSEVFESHVQICTYPDMGMVQEGQPILKDQWSKWDAESIAQKEAQDNQSIEFDVTSVNSDSTVLYDIDADMILDHNIVESESVQSMNVVESLPDINQVRAKLNVLGWSDSPPADFIMPTDYYPSTPRYSPASSPAYSPSMSTITINIVNLNMVTHHHNKMALLLPGQLRFLTCQMMIQIMSWTERWS